MSVVSSARAQGRSWFKGKWQSAGGVPSDSPNLLNPLYLVYADSLVVIYDFGDFAVKAFRKDGALAWRFGRQGQGPKEFGAVVDLQRDQLGRLWVTDASNLRVLILGLDGVLIRQITMSSQVWSALPARADTFYAKLPLRTSFYDIFAPSGEQAVHLPIPKQLLPLDYNQAVMNAVVSPSGVAIAALRWGSVFYVMDLSSRKVGEYVGMDSIAPAPAIAQKIEIRDSHNKPQTVLGHRMDPASEPVYEGVAIDREHAYLLVKGSTANARRIVDQHRLLDGVYEGSYLLPAKVQQIARTPHGFAVLISDPTPEVSLLDWVPASR